MKWRKKNIPKNGFRKYLEDLCVHMFVVFVILFTATLGNYMRWFKKL